MLVTFFSRSCGKLKGIARNAKKSRKRFGGILETGYIVDLHYKTSTRSDISNIDQAILIAPKVYHAKDLPSTVALWLAVELATRFLADGDTSSEKFELLKRFMITIHEGRLKRPILIYFLVKWIDLCGFMPDLDGDDHEPSLYYRLSLASKSVLRSIVSKNMNCDIEDSAFEDILNFIFHYSMIVLGKPLKIKSYLPMLMDIR